MEPLSKFLQPTITNLPIEITPWLVAGVETVTDMADRLEFTGRYISTVKLTANGGVLPIEYFRQFPQPFYLGEGEGARFRSSGTTGGNRSFSLFSPIGLNLYRASAMWAFEWMLQHVFGEKSNHSQGISLIPGLDQWPNSSLAQMVVWLSEAYDVQFSRSSERDFLEALARLESDKPLWVFGTALHWWQLLEGLNTPLSLPRRTIIIETGGTKGRENAFTREALYHRLCQSLGISANQIVSEYGMCELASQAYDWQNIDDGSSRAFRFPPWVALRVCRSVRNLDRSGEGALVVHDPLRVDYPWPIRTQDVVTLDQDGAFQLQGRVEKSPLKGCSLNVEEHHVAERKVGCNELITEAHFGEIVRIDRDSVNERSQSLYVELHSLLSSETLRAAWAREFASQQMADWLVSDTLAMLPASAARLAEMALASMGDASSKLAFPKRWLFLLPESHSLAGFQPLVAAYLLGLDVKLRLPKRFSQSASAAHLLLATLRKAHGALIELVDPDWRLSKAVSIDVDAMLVFGSDETLSSLRELTNVPMQGYGSSLAMSLLFEPTPATLLKIMKDAFAMRQRGCMCVRMLWIVSDDSAELIAEQLQRAYNKLHVKLNLQEELNLDAEELRFRDIGIVSGPRKSDQPLFPGFEFSHMESWSPQECRALVSPAPFVLPFAIIRPSSLGRAVSSLKKWCHIVPEFKLITSDDLSRIPHMPSIELRNLGDANRPNWDGIHQGKPLFRLY